RRQIQLHGQAETEGRPHRRGLRKERCVEEGGRGARLAHGQQAGQGRQEEVRREQQEAFFGEEIRQWQKNLFGQEVGEQKEYGQEIRRQETFGRKEIRR